MKLEKKHCKFNDMTITAIWGDDALFLFLVLMTGFNVWREGAVTMEYILKMYLSLSTRLLQAYSNGREYFARP